MRVLVIGAGGREHAIVRGLKMSASVTEVHAIPGSAGMARDATCHNLSLNNNDEELAQFAQQKDISLVVIGPEAPLAEGLADAFREVGVPVFGPNKAAAHLEASKVFAKEFMLEAKVPTAKAFHVSTVEETLEKAKEFSVPYVLKADGLAAGKGVLICESEKELEAAAVSMFNDQSFGASGERALLEEFQSGWELSYLVLTNGKEFAGLPLAQDHKRLRDDDEGPNTGGMGTVAPMHIDEDLKKKIDEEVAAPTIAAIEKNTEMLYRGVIFIGLMITSDGPKVIEYNVRFGDPETQVVVPLLDGDWGKTLLQIAQGSMPEMKWKSLFSACVVLAAEGYPEAPKKGVGITGDVFAEKSSSYFLHAGTTHCENKHWVTNGGRVLNAVAFGSTMEEAMANAYEQASQVSWPGMQLRKDIGKKAHLR